MQGIAQGALFGDAAVSGDPLNTQSLIVGTSTSGLIISLLRLFTKAAFPTEQAIHISSNLYFLISGMICVLCIYIFSAMSKKKDYGTNQGPEESTQDMHQGDSCEDKSLLGPEGATSMNIHTPDLECSGNLKGIFQKAWQPLLSNMACYWVTLSIFPGVLAEDLNFNDNSWYPLALLTIFNAADCVGKFFPLGIQMKFCSKTSVLLMALLRCSFIPLYLVALGSVPAISILTILLGISNGALTTINMVYATMLVDNTEQQTCGSVSVLFLMLGLNLGAFSGFLWLL